MKFLVVFFGFFLSMHSFAQNLVCDENGVATGAPYKVAFLGSTMVLSSHDQVGSSQSNVSVAPGYQLILKPEQNAAAVYFNQKLLLTLKKKTKSTGEKIITSYTGGLILNNKPDSFNHRFDYTIDQIRVDNTKRQLQAQLTIEINTMVPQEDNSRKLTRFTNRIQCQTNGRD